MEGGNKAALQRRRVVRGGARPFEQGERCAGRTAELRGLCGRDERVASGSAVAAALCVGKRGVGEFARAAEVTLMFLSDQRSANRGAKFSVKVATQNCFVEAM